MEFRNNQRSRNADVIANGILSEVGLITEAMDGHREAILLHPDQAEALGHALVSAAKQVRESNEITREGVIIEGAPLADHLS